MKNTGIKLHRYQAAILKKMISTTDVRFNDLLIDGLESEHMNYHLKQLIEVGFVTKEGRYYKLTDSGKDYSNMLDDNIECIEKQPKTSVIIRGVRKNKKGEVEHLLDKRLRHPYYGKVGRLCGKVRFGETLQHACERELYEETGLKAKTFMLEEIYRKMRKRKDGTFVQDVLFYIFLVKDFYGTFITKTAVQENFWITLKELKRRKDLDVYDDLELEDRMTPRRLKLEENIGVAEGF